MAKFSSPRKQAASVIKEIQGGVLKSVGTARNYEAALTRVAEFIKVNKLGSLRQLSIEKAINYLEVRGQNVGQSQLNMERQSIQMMMKHVTNELPQDKTLPVIKSELTESKNSRAYTQDQVLSILNFQFKQNSLATAIAYSAGLRAHELLTLLPEKDQKPDARPALITKFIGRNGVFYTVVGKGGLTRRVLIPVHLSNQLEKLRLSEPKQIIDRNISYKQYYAINGGNRWSSSFTSASKRSIGKSFGAHGLRHSYAQERMKELKSLGLTRDKALETVSQEMGHFRPDITDTYLR
jgi:integrase